jgi:hypothetical protein
MTQPITFMINVKDEATRLHYVLDVATKWADEVLVIDKGSTDNTVEIAKSYKGVRVYDGSDFGRYGDEDRINWVQLTTHAWIYIGTPSEIPTRKLIDKCREMVDGDYDLITVPRKMYMLGVHSENSPWCISHYKFLVNRNRTLFSNRIHHNFIARNGKEGHIEYADDCCVYHLTYTSALYYINTMKDYWQMEVEGSKNLTADIEKCFADIKQHEQKLNDGGEYVLMLKLAWYIYHYGKALFLEEKRRGMDINAVYKDIYESVMKGWK